VIIEEFRLFNSSREISKKLAIYSKDSSKKKIRAPYGSR
jgi:hypothetical protein